MIEIREVLTKKEQKRFLKFPIKLYRGNDCFVPSLFIDEKKIFNSDYVYNETCDVVFYNAYKDGQMVGRISGIIQRAANEKWNQKRVRFTRFDSINDQEVANALFDAVSAWAKDQGMTEIVGPLGYSDLEREGLLIEGFDQLSTYEEQYNYEYYKDLIENYGFQKEVDWIETKLFVDEAETERIVNLSQKLFKKFNLRLVKSATIKDYIRDYSDQFFEILDKSYENIYGTVPFTQKMIDVMIENFKILARTKDIGTVVDENGKVVGFAIVFPSIADAVRRSKGRITLPFLFRFLRAKKHPKVIDAGLIGVLPEYEQRGVATGILAWLVDHLKDGVHHIETNLVLEDNYHSLNLQKHFKREQHKRRRAYVKPL